MHSIPVTCSTFGPAINHRFALLTIPVLTPNELMFHAAVTSGANIGMLATFDAIVLAHFSTSGVAAAVRARVAAPAFTAPEAAVTRMRGLSAAHA